VYSAADEYTTSPGNTPTNAIVHADGRVFWSLMAVLVGFHCGRVFWSRAARLRSACELDMTLFPFDQQMCVLKFASWTYDLAQVRHRARPPHATQQLRN